MAMARSSLAAASAVLALPFGAAHTIVTTASAARGEGNG